MDIYNTIKIDWVKILWGVLFIVLLTLSFTNINWEKPRFKEGNNWVWYLFLIILGIVAYVFVYHYLSTANSSEPDKFALEFLKTLLPTLLALLTLLYAFSSGLFDLKNERLKMEKENLQYDLNQLEDDKILVQKQKDNLTLEKAQIQDSITDLEAELDSRKKQIDLYEKDIEYLNKQSEEKSAAVNKLVKLNEEFDSKLKELKAKRMKGINLFLAENGYQNLVRIMVNCTAILDDVEMQVTLYDKQKTLLTDKDVSVYTISGYPDNGVKSLGNYNAETKKFVLKHRSGLTMGPDGSRTLRLPNEVNIEFRQSGDKSEDQKEVRFSFETLYENAEYEVIINRQ